MSSCLFCNSTCLFLYTHTHIYIDTYTHTHIYIDTHTHTHMASQVVLVVKNLPANAGDIREVALIPGWGRSPGGRHGNPLQYSCLENPIDRGAWRATVHGVTKSQTQLKQLSMHADTYILAALCVMWDLSFPTRSWIHAPYIGSTESQPLDSQGSPFPS